MRIKLLYIAIISAVVIGLYARVAENDFVGLDDTSLVVGNYSFLKDFSNAPKAFEQGVFQAQGKLDTEKTYYRPVMVLSLMLDAHFAPSESHISPEPFLWANIFYHLLACILLLLLFYALEINPLSALLLALVFAVHPILLQAIAWVPGRNDSILTIFILASTLMLIKFTKSGKSLHVRLHLLLFAMALFTKENAIVFPLIALFYLYKVNKVSVPRKNYLALIIAYCIVAFLWFYIRHQAIAGGGAMIFHEAIKNLLVNAPMFFQYLGKSVIPIGLSVMSTVSDTNYIIGIVAITLIVVGIVLSKQKNWTIIIFGLIWFFLFLTPSFLTLFSGLEHRDYLPIIGLLIVVSQFDIIKNLQFKLAPILNGITLIITLGVILLLASITYSREHIFKNPVTFNESAISTSPNAVLPCLYLARYYEETKDYDKAIDAYREALKRAPNSYMIHNDISGDYIAMNKYSQAEAEVVKELALYPNNKLAVFNLGLINYTYGKDSVALVLWKQSIHIDPNFMDAYNLVASYYLQKGDSTDVMPYLQWLKTNGYPLPQPIR